MLKMSTPRHERVRGPSAGASVPFFAMLSIMSIEYDIINNVDRVRRLSINNDVHCTIDPRHERVRGPRRVSRLRMREATDAESTGAHIHIHIYIYIYRERERYRYTYICIYTYRERYIDRYIYICI